MKRAIGLLLLTTAVMAVACKAQTDGNKNKATQVKQKKEEPQAIVTHLNKSTFQKMVFNYEANKQWKYEGTQPAIIDFYADWCGPCRQVSPIIEELAKEYKGKIVVYKVDTDAERELAQNLGIQSLPTLLFVPVQGTPQAAMGALPKGDLIKAINEVLLVK
jgi:thioredoxin